MQKKCHFPLLFLLIFFIPMLAKALDEFQLSELGSLELNWEDVGDVAYNGELGFIATRHSGLKILDFSTDEIITLSSIDGDFTQVELSEDGQVVIGYEWYEGRVKAYSIENPENPVFLDQLMVNGGDDIIWMEVHGDTLITMNRFAQVRWTDINDFNDITGISVLPLQVGADKADYENGRMVIFADHSDVIRIVDCSDINYPELISTIDMEISYRDIDIEIYGSNLIIANEYYDGSTQTQLSIYDLSDAENLELVTHFPIYGSPEDMQITGTTLFIAESGGGLDIIDISDIESPQRINRLEENYSYVLDIFENRALSCQTFGELNLIDLENLNNPEITHAINRNGIAVDVCMIGDYAYVANLDGGLLVINIEDLENPFVVNRYNPAYFYFNRVTQFGEYLVMMDSDEVLFADLADPESPFIAANWEASQSYGIADFAVAGNAMIIVAGDYNEDSEMVVLELDNSGNVTETYREEFAGEARRIALNENYLYIMFEYSYTYSNIRIFDITVPTNPELVAFTDFDYGSFSITAGNDVLCMNEYNRDIIVYNITNPVYLNEVATIETNEFRNLLEMHGSLLFTADSEDTLRLFDLSTPSAPEYLTAINTNGMTMNMDINDNVIALAEYYSFTLIGIDDSSTEEQTPQKPEYFKINKVYPSPFNASVTVEVAVPTACTLTGRIYDVLGREVASFQRQIQTAGLVNHHWQPQIASGNYFLQLSSNTGWKSVRRIVHVR